MDYYLVSEFLREVNPGNTRKNHGTRRGGHREWLEAHYAQEHGTQMSEHTEKFDTSWDWGTISDYNPETDQLPEGVYTFELASKGPDEAVSAQYDPQGKKTRAKFTFIVVDDNDYEGRVVHQWWNISLNDRAPLRKVVDALMGGRLERNTRVTQALLGKRMTATLRYEPSKTNPDRLYPKLESPLPIRTRRKAEPVSDEVPF